VNFEKPESGDSRHGEIGERLRLREEMNNLRMDLANVEGLSRQVGAFNGCSEGTA
jgi:hypothetical protein